MATMLGYIFIDIPITKKILQEAFSKAKKKNILNKNVSLIHCTSEYPCP